MKQILPLLLILCVPLMGADKGKPLPKDFKSLKALAEKGDAEAQFILGDMYYKAEGVEKDLKEAAKWYRKSAEQGNAKAQWSLGRMYRFGIRVEKDLKEAEKWWRKAAEQGFAFGQNSLGVMYKYGDGVEKDFVTAYAWFNIAAANGHEIAKENKSNVARNMTLEQITKAQELVKEMIKKNPGKELTKENIVGTYQMSLPNGLFTMTLQKDGKSIHDRITNSGEKESDTGKWKIEDGNLFLIGEDMTGIMKINPDRSLVPIAEIKNGVRKNLDPKVSSVVSFKKINEKPTKELTKEEVVGTYEGKGEGTVKFVLHENEKVELFENGNKFLEGTWKMVGKETHLDCKSVIVVIKIEPNGDLNLIARIRNSKREEIAKDPQRTLKKIK